MSTCVCIMSLFVYVMLSVESGKSEMGGQVAVLEEPNTDVTQRVFCQSIDEPATTVSL